jgi:uncharacterized membrane protein YkvA (DUF1232 family)
LCTPSDHGSPTVGAVHRVVCLDEHNGMGVCVDEGSDSLSIERRAEVANPARLARDEPAIDEDVAIGDERIDEWIEVPQLGVRSHCCQSRLLQRAYRQIGRGAARRVCLLVNRVVLVGIAVIAVSWLLMILLAKRLPPGSAKDLASVLPACVTTIRRLRKDPRVPRSAKIAVAISGLWVLSPIDLIPEFLPVIGPLDDVIVVALAFRFAARRVPHDAIYEAWPADPALLDRLLRPRGTRTK